MQKNILSATDGKYELSFIFSIYPKYYLTHEKLLLFLI